MTPPKNDWEFTSKLAGHGRAPLTTLLELRATGKLGDGDIVRGPDAHGYSPASSLDALKHTAGRPIQSRAVLQAAVGAGVALGFLLGIVWAKRPPTTQVGQPAQ